MVNIERLCNIFYDFQKRDNILHNQVNILCSLWVDCAIFL